MTVMVQTGPGIQVISRKPKPANDRFLSSEEELRLARAWRNHGDIEARNKLVTAYMPFALNQARRFWKNRDDYDDIANEAAIGLMKAADRFDPDQGWMFSTYALWWIRASVSDYAIRNHSSVKSPGGVYKRLYFSLRKAYEAVSQQMRSAGQSPNASELRRAVAERLAIKLEDVERFEATILHKDQSLNASLRDDEPGEDWLSRLVDETADTEGNFLAREMSGVRHEFLDGAMATLTQRERDIVTARWLQEDDCQTLEQLGKAHGVSRERIRQIEAKAFAKIRTKLGSRKRLSQMMER